MAGDQRRGAVGRFALERGAARAPVRRYAPLRRILKSVRRLPVIATIREAYAFTFAKLGAIIGLIWLPMVIVTIGDFFVAQNYGRQMQEAMLAGNAGSAGPQALAVLLFA